MDESQLPVLFRGKLYSKPGLVTNIDTVIEIYVPFIWNYSGTEKV